MARRTISCSSLVDLKEPSLCSLIALFDLEELGVMLQQSLLALLDALGGGQVNACTLYMYLYAQVNVYAHMYMHICMYLYA